MVQLCGSWELFIFSCQCLDMGDLWYRCLASYYFIYSLFVHLYYRNFKAKVPFENFPKYLQIWECRKQPQIEPVHCHQLTLCCPAHSSSISLIPQSCQTGLWGMWQTSLPAGGWPVTGLINPTSGEIDGAGDMSSFLLTLHQQSCGGRCFLTSLSIESSLH